MRSTKPGVVLLLSVAVASCASSRQPGGVPERTDAGRAFIAETAIDVPERIDGATLINATREAEVAWGVNAFYRVEALPQARLDLFVYPAGRMPAGRGTRLAQDRFVGDLRQLSGQGSFGNYTVVGEEPFPIPLAGKSTLGAIKTRLWIDKDGDKQASRAYLVWRRDYFLKLRISAPVEDEALLDATADRAARELFAGTHIRSLGDCLRITVHKVDAVPPGQPGESDPVSEDGLQIVLPATPSKDELLAALVVSTQRVAETGCVAEGKLPTVDAGYKRMSLRFEAGDWRSGTDAADAGR